MNKYSIMAVVVKKSAEIIDDWRANLISTKEAYEKLVGEWCEDK